MDSCKKNDRVEFTKDPKTGEVAVGTVSKGGGAAKKARVIEDGGKREWDVPVSMLRPSQSETPRDAPSSLDRWGVSSYKEAGGEETRRFECHITLDGRKVLHASNGGRGGSNFYQPVSSARWQEQRALIQVLEDDVRSFIDANGGGVSFEVIDCWLGWKSTHSRIMTFAQYLEEWRRD